MSPIISPLGPFNSKRFDVIGGNKTPPSITVETEDKGRPWLAVAHYRRPPQLTFIIADNRRTSFPVMAERRRARRWRRQGRPKSAATHPLFPWTITCPSAALNGKEVGKQRNNIMPR